MVGMIVTATAWATAHRFTTWFAKILATVFLPKVWLVKNATTITAFIHLVPPPL
jgi:hypothetical protein